MRIAVLGPWLAFAALTAGTPASPLLAHPTLKRSVPSAGDTLHTGPSELRLAFSEAIESSLSSIRLLGPDGRPVPLPRVSAVGGDLSTLTVPVAAPLPPGAYSVVWQVAGSDGHPVRGRFTFVVAEASASAAAARPMPAGRTAADTASAGAPPGEHHPRAAFPDDGRFGVESPAYVVIRWVSFTALLTIIGVVGFEYLVARPLRRRGHAGSELMSDAARRRAAVLGATAAALLMAASAARLAAQVASLQGPGTISGPTYVVPTLLGTVWGLGWTLQLMAATAALLTFLRMRRTTARGWPAALCAALVLAVTPSLAGHAVAADRYAPLPVLADSLHVLGAAGWLGTLLALMVAGLPAAARLDTPARAPMVAELVSAFSPAALVFAGLTAITGVFAAWLHLGTVAALLESGYGRTLLLKLAILAGVAATGYYNWRRVRPILGADRGTAMLRRTSTVELLVALAVLLVTAVLVATPPPGGSN